MFRPDASLAEASTPVTAPSGPPGLFASAGGRCPSARLRNTGSCSLSSRVEWRSLSSTANAVRSELPPIAAFALSSRSPRRDSSVLGGVTGSKNAILNASRRVASVDGSVAAPSPTR